MPVLSPSDDFEPEFFNDEDNDTSLLTLDEPAKPCITLQPVPKDQYNIIYCVFYLLGTSILLPWYFFVTCNDYWMFRFRDLKNHSDNFHLILHDSDNAVNRTRLQADFTAYISLASCLPSTIFLFFNIFFFRKYSVHWRVLCSMVGVLILFIETTVLVLVDTDSWQFIFFLVTIGTVILLNVATAMQQAALCSIIVKFPLSYISAFSSGMSLGGIFAAVALILTLIINSTPTKSTFLYFIFADITVLASFLGYLFIRQIDFYNYFMNENREPNGSIQYSRLGSNTSIAQTSTDYLAVQMKIWISSVSMFFCYVVTASVYPAIAVLVCSEYTGKSSVWNEKYFVPVITYLLYSCCEYTGRVFAGIIRQPKGVSLVVISALRCLFIPLLMLCNAQPRHHLPVLITSDWFYIIIIVMLALSNGYVANLSFILLPGYVMLQEEEVASAMLVTWLGASLSIGSMLSFPLISML